MLNGKTISLLILLSAFHLLQGCSTTTNSNQWSEEKCLKYMNEHDNTWPLNGQCDEVIGEITWLTN